MDADDGTTAWIEVEVPEGGFGDVAFEGRIVKAKESFERALTDVRTMAFKALDTFRDDARRPDQVELEFGVKFTAEAGSAVFAKTAAEGHLVVRLTWSGGPERGSGPGNE